LVIWGKGGERGEESAKRRGQRLDFIGLSREGIWKVINYEKKKREERGRGKLQK